ncbi:hypothetical protein FE298_09115 [Salmonella enterica subsp. salamae serovar 47:z:e,n,x,z15]|nr:hypothetical protein [Salmonella enterica subsp. salamae serovar 47:z:e,n,x,z15]
MSLFAYRHSKVVEIPVHGVADRLYGGPGIVPGKQPYHPCQHPVQPDEIVLSG